MKKYLTTRNVLILVVIIAIIITICILKNGNTKNSKTYKLFEGFYHNTRIAMQLECIENENSIVASYNRDVERNCETISLKAIISEKNLNEEVITIKNDDHTNQFVIDHAKQEYWYDDEDEEDTISWIDNIIELINENEHYTRGYEFIDGSLTYYEEFKENNLKFYFQNDELKYVKSDVLGTIFGISDNKLYNVTITYDYVDMDTFIEIPMEYKSMT